MLLWMFSRRVPSEFTPNRLTRAVRRARDAGRPLIDLTTTNPTTSGIEYPADVLAALAAPGGLRYAPEPFGLRSAREAVSSDYARRGLDVTPDRIVLTASTSEAYSLLFKLLCDPGERALVPAPSYPLFDHLARLDGVRQSVYRIEYHGRWMVDWDSVDLAWSGDVRAVLAVSPNNPTGSILSDDESLQLDSRCAERGAALIVDEVFADYRMEAGPDVSGSADPGTRGLRAAPEGAAGLRFRLGGLSKSAGLPQVKLGWIAVEGPDALVSQALERLEFVCDTYLSVATPVQVAAPTLIAGGATTRQKIAGRVRGNYDVLCRVAAAHPSVEILHADGGWSAVVRVPATRGEEEIALDLLERDDVVVHPGFFFDFSHEAFLVLSLLPEPRVFEQGVRRLVERVHA
jgi:aspartate/methionine/tyrosine aminotransferase